MFNWAKQQLANVAGTQEPIYGPDAIKSVAHQADSTPYTELQKEHLKWAAMDSTCVETQTFYLMADSGHIGMAQVIYSNVAGIRTTAQFNTKVFYPDQKTPNLWSSDTLSNYGFDDEKLSFYADDVAVTLSGDGNQYTIKSAVNEKSIVNLTVTKLAPGFQVGKDGKTYFGTDPNAPWGSMRHAFWPRNKVEGAIITPEAELDFKGRGFFVHALQGMKPHHAAARWNFVNFQSPTFSAVMMEYQTPPSYASTVVNVGGIARDGEIITANSSNSASHTESQADPENAWPEPIAVKFEWSGKTKDGKEVLASVQGPLGERRDKVDIMAEVPSFIKSIVGNVAGTHPFIYQYNTPLSLKIKIGEEETVEKGTLQMEATFISE
ncbi:MAG: putative cell survival pathways protein [Piccolia ochrophora]|nr:MAG: putative cell survival pathways protein [Piccolia ochrophora]